MYRAKSIDLALLEGDAGEQALLAAVESALAHRPRALCLNPAATDLPGVCVRLAGLGDAGVLRAFVVDFPLGQGGRAGKIAAAESLARRGVVDEFDVVANVAAILRDDYDVFEAEIVPVVAVGLPVKVIVETGYYATDGATLLRALDWCARAGAAAIKTSTGVLKNIDNAAKREHVALWSARIRERGYALGIKDSGGKRSREDIDLALEAGATIIGSSRVID